MTTSPQKILLIEDDDNARAVMAAILASEGYQVSQANTGTRGVFQYHVSQPDLVITDVIMEGQEGIQTLLQLRRQDPRIRVIVVSGGGQWHSSDYCLKMALSLGARAVLAKPFSKAQFVTTVAEVLRENVGDRNAEAEGRASIRDSSLDG